MVQPHPEQPICSEHHLSAPKLHCVSQKPGGCPTRMPRLNEYLLVGSSWQMAQGKYFTKRVVKAFQTIKGLLDVIKWSEVCISK